MKFEANKLLHFLFSPFFLLVRNSNLFRQLLKREITQKYRGSYLGILWNFIVPITMMIVYSFVFGVVFKARWDYQVSESNAEFAVILFVGIALYTVFSETVNIAPTLITSNANYVKKVVFPLELLSMTSVGSSLVQFLFNLVVILVSKVAIIGRLDATMLLLPIILIPLIFLTLGISWILSAIGTYVRDMRQASTIITLIFGYATPVFFPFTAVPENLRWVLELNPMTTIVNNARNVLIYGVMPDWLALGKVWILSYIVMLIGFQFFQKVKPGFADAI